MNKNSDYHISQIYSFILILCSLFFHSISHAKDIKPFELDSNTVALWHMDSVQNNAGFYQVNDEAGNFNLQQTRKNKALKLVDSVGGSGKSITGFNNYTGSLDLVDAINAGLTDSTTQTFEAWIKWENDYFLPKRRASTKQTVMARLVGSTSSAWLYFINNQIKLSIRSGDGRKDEKIYTAVANPRSGIWYHVAFTIEVNDFDQQGDKNDTRVKLYFNDANNTDSTPEPLTDITTKSKGVVYEDFAYRANGWLFRIGKRYRISNAEFRGYIDDIRLSDIAKTTFDVFGSVVSNKPTPVEVPFIPSVSAKEPKLPVNPAPVVVEPTISVKEAPDSVVENSVLTDSVTPTTDKGRKAFALDSNTIALWHMDAVHKNAGFYQVDDEAGNFHLQQTRNNQSLKLVNSVGGLGKSITGFSNYTGSLDLVDAIKAGLPDSTSQTFEAWIKWDNKYLLPKRRASIKQTVMTRLVSSTSSAWLYFVNNQIKLSIRSGDGRRDEKIYTAVANPRSGVWYHVAFTIEVNDFDQQGDKNDTQVKLYFNDTNNTDSTPEPLTDITTKSKGVVYEDFEYRANGWLFRIGKRYRISNADFRGLIDDVRLSNVVKTTFDVFETTASNDNEPTTPIEVPFIPSAPVAEPTQPEPELVKPVSEVAELTNQIEKPKVPITPVPQISVPTKPVIEAPAPTLPIKDEKQENVDTFVVMQSLLFDANKPSNNEFVTNYGMDFLPELGHGFNMSWDVAGGDNPFYDAPNEGLVKKWAKNSTTKMGYIDIEHLPTTFYDDWDDDWNAATPPVKVTDADRGRAIDEMISIADWAHEANPDLTIGYYGVLPQREYWALVLPNYMRARLNKLQQRNDQFKALADHVDVLYPSLYTFYNKPEEWKVYAKGMIEEARKYNKPAYAFIWPIYHPSNKALGGQFIGGDYWRLQLETIYELGYDGVVIWGGWKEQWNVSASDTDPSNWWYQTLDFMYSKGLLPVGSTWKP